MKPKIILLFLGLTAISFASNAQLNKKYDKASFTVVPLSYSIKDTLAKDTSVNWSKLPYYSLLLSDVSSKHINAVFETSGKFFYNKTTIPENYNFIVPKKDTIAFENLFGKQMLKEGYPRQKFRNYQLPQYQKLPKHSTKNDSYGKWIQGQLEFSSVPGEMMYLWTNENVLMSRSEDNIDHRDKSRGANSSSFNYYKKLLEKNYIVVQNSIVTQKYIVKPEILEAEKKAREIAEKRKSFITKTTDFIKKQKEAQNKRNQLKKEKKEGLYVNPYKIDSNKFDKNRLTIEKSEFVKSYVFKILLTPELMSDLSSYPAVMPKSAKLEFVYSYNADPGLFGKSNRIKSLNTIKTAENLVNKSSIKGKIKNIGKKNTELTENYKKGKTEVSKLIQLGEYYCANQIINQLLQYKNHEAESLDSLKKICEKELKANPEVNPIAFKNASNIQKKKPLDFAYQKKCLDFAEVEASSEINSAQTNFDALTNVLEKNLKDFQLLTNAESVKKNKIEVNLETSQGIYSGQQFKIVERVQNKKGERFDSRIGTVKIIKPSKNLYQADTVFSRTVMAQVDGRKIDKGVLLIEDDVKGIAAFGGYGYRYKERAVLVGVDFPIRKLSKYPGLKVGLNMVQNVSLSNLLFESYNPRFFNLAVSNELFLSRIFDIKPFVEVGYGGDFKNETPVKRSAVLTAGFGVPLNTFNRKTSQKLKIMPEFSFSTERRSPQICIISKIEF
jgi:hypothetical protein